MQPLGAFGASLSWVQAPRQRGRPRSGAAGAVAAAAAGAVVFEADEFGEH